MSRHPIEALLRPPVELWSTLVAFATAAIAVLAPWALMMPPGVAYSAGAALAVIGVMRARQAWRVMRYQRNMRRLPIYRLRADKIPLSRHKLFLGKGFRWTQKHTQRLRDTIRPEVQHYVQPGALYQWARRKEVAWESIPLLNLVAWFLRSRGWWNPLAPLPPVGGKPALHAVEPDEQDVWMDIGERVGHTLVLGTTRVGKTRLAEILIAQDIRRGDVVIVFDPKGDADLLRRVYAEAKRAGRAKDFYMFHLGLPRGLGPLQRHRQLLPHHRGRDPHRQPAAERGQLGRLQGIRVAFRQHHRPRPGGTGPPAGLPADAPLHQRHRAAVRRIRARTPAPARGGGLAREGGGHRRQHQRAQPAELAARSQRRGHRADAASAGTRSLRPGARRTGIGLQVRQDLFRQDRQLRGAADGEADHRQDRRAHFAGLPQ